jgi:hypothetical protein
MKQIDNDLLAPPQPSPTLTTTLTNSDLVRVAGPPRRFAWQPADVDFEPIPDLEFRGFRLATVEEIASGALSGDAILLAPDSRAIDVRWHAGQREPSASWSPPTVPGSLGVIRVEITERVETEGDLGPVLEATVVLMEPILAAGIEPTRP